MLNFCSRQLKTFTFQVYNIILIYRMELHVGENHPDERIRPCGCKIPGKIYSMVYKACYQRFRDGEWICVGRQNKVRPGPNALPDCLPVCPIVNGLVIEGPSRFCNPPAAKRASRFFS